MKASTLLTLAASTLATAQSYSPFTVTDLVSHQPNGYPGGQVNYWRIGFNVESANGDGNSSGYCNNFWGDNGGYPETAAYSVNVPTGTWIQCDSSEDSLGDDASDFAFQLFPRFALGNYKLEVRQTIATTQPQTVLTSTTSISNTTSAYTYNCTIDPQESGANQVPRLVHASGDCELQGSLSLPVTASNSGACTSNGMVPVAFPVTRNTRWGETVYVVGSTASLGNWNIGSGHALNADQYTSTYNLWNGTVMMKAGTRFEYKFASQDHGLSRVRFECCENRVFTVPANACGAVTANGVAYYREIS